MGDKTKWETTTTTTIIDDQICRRLRPAYKKNAGGEFRTWHTTSANQRLRKHSHQGLTVHV